MLHETIVGRLLSICPLAIYSGSARQQGGEAEMTSLVYRRAIDLMEAELGDELVALDPTGGSCFGFNSVASSVWRNLEQPRRFDELRDSLLGEYEVDPAQCTRELRDLLDDLCARGLVTTAG